MPYLFSFGSNMDSLRLKNRIGDFPKPEVATLKNAKIVFDKKAGPKGKHFGATNILLGEDCIRSHFHNFLTQVDMSRPALVRENDEVQGMLTQLRDEQIKVLDRYEGINTQQQNGYRRVLIPVQRSSGEIIEAYTYIALSDMALRGETTLKPTFEYACYLLAPWSEFSREYQTKLLNIQTQDRGRLGDAFDICQRRNGAPYLLKKDSHVIDRAFYDPKNVKFAAIALFLGVGSLVVGILGLYGIIAMSVVAMKLTILFGVMAGIPSGLMCIAGLLAPAKIVTDEVSATIIDTGDKDTVVYDLAYAGN